MSVKFDRKYRLTIETNDGSSVVIEQPLTLQFSVQRSSMASVNSATFQITNLSEEVRNSIFQDRFSFLKYKRVIFEAGYDDLAVVFVGSLFEANSSRQGVDIVTNITARDGGFDTVTSKTFATIQKNTSIKDLLKGLIGSFTNLKEGVIGDIQGTLLRPAVLDGNTFYLLKTYSEDKVFIDLEKVNILKNSEVLTGQVPLISPETGLLETPRRDDAYLTVVTLFEPRIIMSQFIELKSSILKQYNGQYKVLGVHHQGVISGAINGNCTSTFNLLLEGQLFGSFSVV